VTGSGERSSGLARFNIRLRRGREHPRKGRGGDLRFGVEVGLVVEGEGLKVGC